MRFGTFIKKNPWSHRVLGLDVYLVAPDDPVLVCVGRRVPAHLDGAGVDGAGADVGRLAGDWVFKKKCTLKPGLCQSLAKEYRI